MSQKVEQNEKVMKLGGKNVRKLNGWAKIPATEILEREKRKK